MIKTKTPAELDLDEVTRLLDETQDCSDLSERIERFSARFLDSAYFASPLEGGPDSREVFKVSLKGFDCVTYMETVIALALSETASEFVEQIRRLRYAGGEVDWYHRNHYMIDWVRNNQKRGIIRNITAGPRTVLRQRRLSVIEALPEKRVSFRCFPKRSFKYAQSRIKTGDAVLFVSTKKTLDVFHTAILIKGEDALSVRHASRAAGRVIEEGFADFLRAHRMTGFILLRTLCRD